MSSEHFLLLARVQVAFYLTVVLFAFIKYRSRDNYVKGVGILFLGSACADGLGLTVIHYHLGNPNYFSSAYNILALPVSAWIYYLVTGKSRKKTFILFALLHVTFAVANILFIQKQAFNTYTQTSLAIMQLMFCLYYFYWLLKAIPTTNLSRLPMFWINSAFMVYYAGNLFLIVFSSYLMNELKVNFNSYWWVHNFLGIIEMSIIIFALWIDLKMIRQKSIQ